MLIIAIDPGQSGAIACYDTQLGKLDIADMPTETRGEKGKCVIDARAVYELLSIWKDAGAEVCFVEQVWGIRGQAAGAAFIFGEGYGTVCAAALILGYRLERIPAATWKAALKVPADKSAAITRASEMIPTHRSLWAGDRRGKGSLPQRSGRAEAAMIALYGERCLKMEGKKTA